MQLPPCACISHISTSHHLHVYLAQKFAFKTFKQLFEWVIV